ncbi:MAG TPA: dihydrodipicolinate synthase family protein [Candidatus Brocadiia bacterium]|nr:dihydrodipicolinate synthase family protein [Candidatus Brocadiia bacterium]
MPSKFKGVFPAVVTPIDARGRFNPDAMHKLAQFLIPKGVHGCYVTGSTGEGLLLNVKERKAVAKTAVEAFGKKGKVIVHIGAMGTRDTADLAAHAAEVGAAGISSIPPIYFPHTMGDIIEYYRAVGKAAGIPMFVYSIPALLNRSFTADDLARFREIPEFAGIKFTDYNLYELRNMRDDFGPDFTIFNGYDQVFACGLAMGADAGIGSTYNFMPEMFVAVYKAFTSGDTAKAFDFQHKLNRIIRIAIRGNALATTKVMLRFRGVDCGKPIPPIREPLPNEIEETEGDLKKLGFPDEYVKEAVEYMKK